MRFVPINNVFLAVQDEVGDDWNGEKPLYADWVKHAIKIISSPVSFDRVIEVKSIEDKLRIKICDDTYGVQALALGDQKRKWANVFSNDCRFINLPTFIPGNNEFGNGFLVVAHGIEHEHGMANWTVRDGYVVFQNKVNNEKATLLSKKFKRDKDGKLMVAETDVMAAAHYILMKMARRTQWGAKEQRMTRGIIADYDQIFTNQVMNARAEGAKLSETQDYQLSQMQNFRDRYAYTHNE
jgi:hypothetical protein